MSEDTRRYLRFLVSDRVLHLLLLISFSMLALTGLVQKYADAGISVTLIRAMGGIEQTRLIHHTFAVILIMTSIAHAVQVGYRIYVQRKPLSMLPTLKDVTDFIGAVKYNVGLSKEKPHFPRFNFMEKIEYWAVVWGTVLMTITGYVLWNPVLITQYLPGEVVPAAKIAHGMEAVLAVLSIVTWHVYYVHVKVFNKSMFTGYLSEEEMEQDHGAELEKRLTGKTWRAPTPEVRYRRLKLYAPLATVFVLVSVLATWRWLTAETTAITTVPRAAVEERAYQPVGLAPRTVTLALTPVPTPLSVLSVTTGATESAPTEAPPPASAGLPAAIPHPIDGGQAQCLQCHATDSAMKPAPASHAGFTVDQCTTCHVAGGAPPAAPPGVATPSAPPTSTGSAPAPAAMPLIPHTITGDWAQCRLCHAIDGGMRPMPAGHASFEETQCLSCHQAEGGGQ